MLKTEWDYIVAVGSPCCLFKINPSRGAVVNCRDEKGDNPFGTKTQFQVNYYPLLGLTSSASGLVDPDSNVEQSPKHMQGRG